MIKKFFKVDYILMIIGGLWTENGNRAIKDNRLIMLFNLNSQASTDLAALAPEQRGLWRLTKPPLYAVSWTNDNRIAMNAASTKKEEAWKVMEYIVAHKANSLIDKKSICEYLQALRSLHYVERKDAYLGNREYIPCFI